MERVNLQEGWRFAKANSDEWTPVSAVSYTHLTLPTNSRV